MGGKGKTIKWGGGENTEKNVETPKDGREKGHVETTKGLGAPAANLKKNGVEFWGDQRGRIKQVKDG